MMNFVRFVPLLAALFFSTVMASASGSQSTASDKEPFSFRHTKNVLILLDCSESMNDKSFAKAKFLASQIVSLLPNDVNCGIRVFGEKKQDFLEECRATKNIRAVSPHARECLSLFKQLRLTGGKSPLTLSLNEALEKDLSMAKGKSVVVLISEGEDTCGQDPLKKLNEKLAKMPVVCLSMHKPTMLDRKPMSGMPARADLLSEIAQESHGKYYDFQSTDSFIRDFLQVKDQ